MKRRSKSRRKKNPAGKWIALGVGAAAAIGLAGYGIYRYRKGKTTPVGSGEWTYRLIPQPSPGGQPMWLAQVIGPSGTVTNIGPLANQQAAIAAAQNYIYGQGGTPATA